MNHPFPDAPWHNTALHSKQELESALAQVLALHLPPHGDPNKNWDHLAAIDLILNNTPVSASILDVGPDDKSVILPWLALYGYKHLIGINPIFKAPFKRDDILYLPGDITHTNFANAVFDVITSMSVIEHGVAIEKYFQETARILKPGGYLVTSTDYYPDPVATGGKRAFGVPIRIFSKHDIEAFLDLASTYGFRQTGGVLFECHEKPIHWKGLSYSFIIFSLKKA